MREQRLKLYELPDYRPRIGRHNNYGYNAAEQTSQTFTGMGFDINVHDQWAIESQGRIQDRTREHLGTSDKAIVAYRRMLLSAIGQVGERREAADVARRRARAARSAARSPSTASARPRAGRPTGRTSTRAAAAARAGRPRPCRRWSRRRAMTLVERAGLWTEDRKTATREAERRIQAGELSVVRLAFADQHGVLRGKTLTAGEVAARAEERRRLHHDDAAQGHLAPHGVPGLAAGRRLRHARSWRARPTCMMLPDPSTFRVLPWAPHTGWMLCDIVFADGRPVPLSTRQSIGSALQTLDDAGYDFVAGLEVEFHLFKLEKAQLGLGDAAQPGQPGAPPECRCSTRATST